MKQEALQSKEQQLEEAHQKIKELQQLLGKKKQDEYVLGKLMHEN